MTRLMKWLNGYCSFGGLIDPLVVSLDPRTELIRLEPESNLLLCCFHTVAAMANVAMDMEAVGILVMCVCVCACACVCDDLCLVQLTGQCGC